MKGLDFALLEQQKLKASASAEVDDLLETAFQESSSKTTTQETRKRTREEIVSELKSKRLKGNDVPPTPQDDIKQSGKFKPLGFKPIGDSTSKDSKKLKKKGKVSDRKSKAPPSSTEGAKDALNSTTTQASKSDLLISSAHKLPDTPNSIKMPSKEPDADAFPGEDLDIFAGVDDYDGLGDDDDDADDGDEIKKPLAERQDVAPAVPSRGWFEEDEEPEEIGVSLKL